MKMNCTKVVSRKQAFGPSIVDYDLIASQKTYKMTYTHAVTNMKHRDYRYTIPSVEICLPGTSRPCSMSCITSVMGARCGLTPWRDKEGNWSVSLTLRILQSSRSSADSDIWKVSHHDIEKQQLRKVLDVEMIQTKATYRKAYAAISF